MYENYYLLLAAPISVCLFLILYFGSWFIQRLYAWVNDSKTHKHNWFLRKAMYSMGWKDRDDPSYWFMRGDDVSDGSTVFSLTLKWGIALPFMLIFYIPASIILLVYSLLLLLRLIVRHHKVVKAHMDDDAIHHKP